MNPKNYLIIIVLLLTSTSLIGQDPFGSPQQVLAIGATNGVTIIDYNNDGYPDVFLSNGAQTAPANRNFLFINNGNSTFTQQSTSFGDITSDNFISGGASIGDYNNDGNDDIIVANVFTSGSLFNYKNQNDLFRNNGNNSFTEIGFEAEHQRYAATVAFADVNKDGLLDAFFANSALQGAAADNKLYINSAGTFSIDNSSNLSSSSSARAGCAWADYDRDGDMDIVIASGSIGQKTSLWKFDGTNFTETVLIPSGSGGKTSESISWGDYDNDGDFDLFVANSGDTDTSPEANLLFNNNSGTLTQVANGDLTTDVNLTSCAAWGDYDNDGDLDMVQAIVGSNTDGHHSRLYTNSNGVLTENSNATNIINNANFSNSVAFLDYDNDGDLDLIFGRDGDNMMFANNSITTGVSGANNKFTSIKCIGNAPSTNKSAIGTVISLFANINSQEIAQLRDVSSQSGKGSQSDLRVHFGLGNASKIDSIKAKFPSGVENIITDLPVDMNSVLVEGNNNVSSIIYPSQDFLYLFGNTGGSVHFTTADSDGGDLTMIRSDTDPGGTFNSSSATSANSSTITPNAVYSDKYWTVTQTNLTGYTATVYFDASGLTDSPNLDDVVLLKRANSGTQWTALNTNRIGNTLIATGITSFSEFAIGYESASVLVETKIFLQGSYNSSTDEMNININASIPLTSPYSEDPRTVSSIPSDVVDWILVELRAVDNESAVVSKSAFLHKDGRIVNDDATLGVITLDVSAGDYYIVLKHRNHLPVMSTNKVSLSESTSALYDFSN